MSRTNRIAATAGAVVLALAGVLHGLWAAGMTWPARGARDLAREYAASQQLPPRPLIAVAAIAIVTAAIVLFARLGVLGPVPLRLRRLVQVGSWAVAAGLLLRALIFLGQHIAGFPASTPHEFIRPDLVVYDPLCLLLGIGAGIAAWRGDSGITPAGAAS